MCCANRASEYPVSRFRQEAACNTCNSDMLPHLFRIREFFCQKVAPRNNISHNLRGKQDNPHAVNAQMRRISQIQRLLWCRAALRKSFLSTGLLCRLWFFCFFFFYLLEAGQLALALSFPQSEKNHSPLPWARKEDVCPLLFNSRKISPSAVQAFHFRQIAECLQVMSCVSLSSYAPLQIKQPFTVLTDCLRTIFFSPSNSFFAAALS